MRTPLRAGLILAPFATLVALGTLLLLPALSASRPAFAADTPALDCAGEAGQSAQCQELVELQVKDVVPLTEVDSHAVVLITQDGAIVLPIFVDEGAAVAIAFRLAHRDSPHPLAQDLLDTLVAELGGQVTEVHIEDVKNDVYTGRVFIRQGEKEHKLAARPSDSIAMALKGSAPILVTRKVLGQAGIAREEIDNLRRGGSSEGPGVGGSGELPPGHPPVGPHRSNPHRGTSPGGGEISL